MSRRTSVLEEFAADDACPAVSLGEAAVIGTPDELRGEVVEAYVGLAEGLDGNGEPADELKRHVGGHCAVHAYLRCIEVVTGLPRTPSGKIQRVASRQQRQAQLSATADDHD